MADCRQKSAVLRACQTASRPPAHRNLKLRRIGFVRFDTDRRAGCPYHGGKTAG